MELNVVRVAEDADFERVRRLAMEEEGWSLVFSKKTSKVWTRPAPKSSASSDFHMIRARVELPDVAASTAYDVLHDPDYRGEWDKYMMESADIGLLSPNTDLCYYAVRSPPPLRHRDFVLQRNWLDVGTEAIIFNHSVCHSDFPPRKEAIRAVSYLTGYVVKPLGPHSCQLTYVTHSDPRGKLPSWLINKITTIVTPKMMRRLHKACQGYQAWKARNNPDWKPWSRPDQLSPNRLDLSKCRPQDLPEVVDESGCGELRLDDEENGRSTTPLPPLP